MPELKQDIFKGMAVNVDPLDLPDTQSSLAENVDLSTLGELKSFQGMAKQVTTAFTSSVMYVHQLEDDVYAWTNSGEIQKL